LADGIQRDEFAWVDTNLQNKRRHDHVFERDRSGTTKSIDATVFVGPQEEKKSSEALAPGLEVVGLWMVNDSFALLVTGQPCALSITGAGPSWRYVVENSVLLAQCQAYASMAKMKAINPKITEMRERLKDKPQEMQQAMMKIYRTKGQTDGWLFPDLIQIPVFIALYQKRCPRLRCATRPGFCGSKTCVCTRPIFLSCLSMTPPTTCCKRR
jgi:YidC/Oxa1 family membrane protein insertase